VTPVLTLRIPLPSLRARRVIAVLLMLACCALMLSGDGHYPAGAPVRSRGVTALGDGEWMVRLTLFGEDRYVLAPDRETALALDAVLWRVGQGRPGYVFVPYKEAE